MKVKIKKAGKTKTYNLIDSWSDVTLERWLKLVGLDEESKTKEAEETIAALSDMPRKLVKELSLRDVAAIMGKVAEIQGQQDSSLKKVIEIEGVEYAMHPNLDDITLGEYADIESIVKDGIQKNLPELMAILFRPVLSREDDVCVIAAYDGNIRERAEIMKKMAAEQVQSALVFFYHLGMVFLKTLPSYLVERTQEMKELQMETLQNAGDGSE